MPLASTSNRVNRFEFSTWWSMAPMKRKDCLAVEYWARYSSRVAYGTRRNPYQSVWPP
jgi:hypothetical protein